MGTEQTIFDWLPSWHLIVTPVLLLLIGGILILTAQKFLRRYTNRLIRLTDMTAGTAMFLRRLVGGAMWLVLVLLLLRQVGVNVDGVWTILASTLAVIGVGLLAVWTMVSNLTASLFIWIWRPYEFGERIELLPDEIKGRVVDRSLMFTTLREEDGCLLMVPNNQFFQRVVRRSPVHPFETEFERWEAEHGLRDRQPEPRASQSPPAGSSSAQPRAEAEDGEVDQN